MQTPPKIFDWSDTCNVPKVANNCSTKNDRFGAIAALHFQSSNYRYVQKVASNYATINGGYGAFGEDLVRELKGS